MTLTSEPVDADSTVTDLARPFATQTWIPSEEMPPER